MLTFLEREVEMGTCRLSLPHYAPVERVGIPLPPPSSSSKRHASSSMIAVEKKQPVFFFLTLSSVGGKHFRFIPPFSAPVPQVCLVLGAAVALAAPGTKGVAGFGVGVKLSLWGKREGERERVISPRSLHHHHQEDAGVVFTVDPTKREEERRRRYLIVNKLWTNAHSCVWTDGWMDVCTGRERKILQRHGARRASVFAVL